MATVAISPPGARAPLSSTHCIVLLIANMGVPVVPSALLSPRIKDAAVAVVENTAAVEWLLTQSASIQHRVNVQMAPSSTIS